MLIFSATAAIVFVEKLHIIDILLLIKWSRHNLANIVAHKNDLIIQYF